MIIKLKEIVNSVSALQEVSKLSFPATQAFELAKMLETANEELSLYDKVRNAKILQYSSDQKKVDDDKIDDFFKDINELLEKEIELPDFRLEKSDFEEKDITAQQVMLLKWLIK